MGIYNYLRRQSFQPDILGIFTNPFYFIRKNLFKNIQDLAPQLKGKLLDFGCGRKPFENLFNVSDYIGVDMAQTGHDHRNSRVDIFYDGSHIPVENEYFDCLFCSEVLEHVFEPDSILPEIRRVLKKNSLAIFTVPFCWNEHEIPYDYARYSSFGITHLLEKNGFKVISCKKSGNFVQVVVQLWSLYFFEIFRKFKKTGYLISMVFIVPIHLLGSLADIILPNNKSLYFNNIVLAERID